MREITVEEMIALMTTTEDVNDNNTSVTTLGALELQEKYGRLVNVFESSIRQTNRDIAYGADSSSFYELTILNFLWRASLEGYEADIIQSFLVDAIGKQN